MSALSRELDSYGVFAYLVYVRGEAPHTTPVTVDYGNGEVSCSMSETALVSICRNSEVSILWPAADFHSYALILNGKARVDTTQGRIFIAPTKLVKHRAGALSEGDCRGDCILLRIDD